MSPNQEYWDLVNADMKKLGPKIQRGSTMPEGTYHVAVEIVPTDMKGHVLITQRSPFKKMGAGKYEFPAGSVLSGESVLRAAVRELQEETGLIPDKLHFIQKNIPRAGLIRVTFLAYIENLTEKKIVLQQEECVNYKFITLSQWQDMRVQDMFDSERIQNYKHEFYESLYKMVGTPPEEEVKAPKEIKPVTLRKVEGLGLKKVAKKLPENIEVTDSEDGKTQGGKT